MTEPPLPDLLLVGKVIRPHGLEGTLRIWSFALSEETFLQARTVFFRNASGNLEEFTVISVKPYRRILLMNVNGISSVDEAERFRGAEIMIDKETLKCEEEGEYFWYELLGLKVYLDTGEYLGKLFRIIPAPGNDFYVVMKEKKEILIPATWEVVREVDLQSGRMIVSPPEGLLELNEV